MIFTVEPILPKESNSPYVDGPSSFDVRPCVNGVEWLRWQPERYESITDSGVRDKWMSPDRQFFMKSEPYGTGQNSQEVDVWKSVIGTPDERYFVPILANGVIELPRRERSDVTAPWKDTMGYFSWVINPYMRFETKFNEGMQSLLMERVDLIRRRYGIIDWGETKFRQFKAIDHGTAFMIHDYPGRPPSNLTEIHQLQEV